MSKDTILIKEEIFQSLTFKAIYGRKLNLVGIFGNSKKK
jgi:hypothetical protein